MFIFLGALGPLAALVFMSWPPAPADPGEPGVTRQVQLALLVLPQEEAGEGAEAEVPPEVRAARLGFRGRPGAAGRGRRPG